MEERGPCRKLPGRPYLPPARARLQTPHREAETWREGEEGVHRGQGAGCCPQASAPPSLWGEGGAAGHTRLPGPTLPSSRALGFLSRPP